MYVVTLTTVKLGITQNFCNVLSFKLLTSTALNIFSCKKPNCFLAPIPNIKYPVKHTGRGSNDKGWNIAKVKVKSFPDLLFCITVEKNETSEHWPAELKSLIPSFLCGGISWFYMNMLYAQRRTQYPYPWAGNQHTCLLM